MTPTENLNSLIDDLSIEAHRKTTTTVHLQSKATKAEIEAQEIVNKINDLKNQVDEIAVRNKIRVPLKTDKCSCGGEIILDGAINSMVVAQCYQCGDKYITKLSFDALSDKSLSYDLKKKLKQLKSKPKR